MSGFEAHFELERRTEGGEPFRVQIAFSTGPGVSIVFGPSGSGKSTLLLAILGALPVSRGRIAAGGRTLVDTSAGVRLPVAQRGVGMVFQEALLFPHLDALANVAFGARGSDGVARAERWLARVGGAALARRRPGELSGGERQRVALARALAARPSALLLDEPFASLDAPARESLGNLLLELQREEGLPFLHVTHDPGEALRLGDELILLRDGRVARTGSPADVITRPDSLDATWWAGTDNLFYGTVTGHADEDGLSEVDVDRTKLHVGRLDLPLGARVVLGLRSEDVLVAVGRPEATSARNVLAGTVQELRRRGPAVELRVTTPATFRVLVTPLSVRDLALVAGRRVHLLIKAAAFRRLG